MAGDNDNDTLLSVFWSSPLASASASALPSHRESTPDVSSSRLLSLASRCASHLNLGTSGPSPSLASLSSTERNRLLAYYVPVYLWCENLREEIIKQKKMKEAENDSTPTLVVGVSAPQGCGKTTLVEELARLFRDDGVNCCNVSLDDFYLRGEQQDELAAKHPENSLLQFRGNFGSHDPDLGIRTIDALRQASKGDVVKLPRYDKALRGGRGDRAPESTWPQVTGPVDVVLLEGWSLGFTPVGEERAVSDGGPELAQVDKYLNEMPYGDLHERCDGWIVVQIEDPKVVFEWRLQQEVALRKVKGDENCLTDEQVSDFVDRFMPAYKGYLSGLYANGPHRANGRPTLAFYVDANRTPFASP